MKVLVTGGAGFIGSHITDELIKRDHNVTVIDNLVSTQGSLPEYFNKKATFIKGDVRDIKFMSEIVKRFDIIFHEAASVGIAQSNYEPYSFIENNCLGTANLLQAIINAKVKPKVILSASNTTYGEGLYSCETHGKFHPQIRTPEDIKKNGFEPVCINCNQPGKAIPTTEDTGLHCNSVYALTKKFQEELLMMQGKMYGFPIVLLKYFNVFGPRQSLNNPYTGVSAIFMSRALNNNPIVIYEDGLQTRDFVFIHDVVNANMLAMENSKADYHVFNVGSGKPVTIKALAEEICKIYGKEIEIRINKEYRNGDIRHCVADNSSIANLLGWKPQVSFRDGLKKIIGWSRTQKAEDNFEKAQRELKEKGLVRY